MGNDSLFNFEDASRENILLKMALCGPPGSGKTRSALGIAALLAKLLNLGAVYFIDSENRSSLKYAFNQRTGKGFHFKALHLPKDNYSPQNYMRALDAAEKAGAKIIIIDSLSHAWNGVGGILEQVDDLTAHSNSKNAFSEGWRKATPIQRQFVQAILGSPAHIIATMRSDPDWVVQENAKGKKEPTMIGLSPQQRKDISFEFDIVLNIDRDHVGKVDKTRCEELNDYHNGVFQLPGENVAAILVDWIKTSDQTTPEQEVRLAEELERAVADGVAAAKKNDKAAYKAARKRLSNWLDTSGLAAPRREAVLDALKRRVEADKPSGAADKPVAPATSEDGSWVAGDAAEPPASGERGPTTDAELLAAIDQGRA